MARILVVDDEIGIRELLSEILSDEGYVVILAENAAVARKVRAQQAPDLVLLDIWMPDMDGISLLKEWSVGGLLTMPVVMMSGHGTIDTAVEATRIGAVGFLEKPIALQKLLATVKDTLKHKNGAEKSPLTLDAFSNSTLLKDFRKRLAQAAEKTNVLLIKNASGAIAEICARTLQKPRTPWLDLTGSSVPLTQQMLEDASDGILFVGDLAAQSRLQQKNLVFALERLAKYRLRLIVACPCALSALDEAGWNPLLLAHLGEAWINMPQISTCADEAPEIARLLLSYLVDHNEAPERKFSEEALNALRGYEWKGEWSELLATVKSLALFALEEEISPDDVDDILQRDGINSAHLSGSHSLFHQSLRDAREAFERLYFEYHLKNEQGNMVRIADKTGLERTHLYRKLKQLGLNYGRRSEESDS